jgi:hypothetical protein
MSETRDENQIAEQPQSQETALETNVGGLDRRSFLGGIGTAVVSASMAGGATVAVAALGGPAVEEAAADEIGPDRPNHRRNNAYKVKVDAAKAEKQLGTFKHDCNGDEVKYPSFVGNFHKTLPHDPVTGEVDPAAYAQLLKAIESGDFAEFELVPAGGVGRLANPLGAISYNMEGPDTAAVPVPPPPSVDSPELAADMAERYWMALLRDKSFATWATDPDVLAACDDLSDNYSVDTSPRDPVTGRVTPQTLFRINAPGVLDGPMVSQFLTRAFTYDGIQVNPLMRVSAPGEDFMTAWTEFINIQSGALAAGFPPLDPVSRFPRNARDLGLLAALDRVYSAYFRAVLILQAIFPFNNSPGLDANHPYQTSVRQSGFATFGLAHILEMIASVGKAERHTWYSKWNVNRLLRPEAYGGLVQRVVADGASYPIHSDLLNNTALLDRVFARNLARNTARGLGGGTYLLPQVLRGGSPNHPSYPAGHGISAGASITVLKAFYNEAQPFPTPVKVAADGLTTTPYVAGVDGPALTLGGELNKLAFNMSFGRDMSGVHWRADSMVGLLQGEEVAIRWLAEQRATFREPFAGFNLTKFDGTTIVV